MDVSELQYAFSEDGKHLSLQETERLRKFKRWFSDAVEASQEWRTEAKEDIEFYNGKQWNPDDKKTLEDSGRPAITVNRVKPLINVLSGYQRLNRYDIDFLPRTNDDMRQAQLRKGITKYILDRSHYNYEESDGFKDGILTGLGWYEVGYQFDWGAQDGDAYVRRTNNFDIYVDPESRDKYFRDAKFIVRARWIDKEELKEQYPEHKDEIEAQAEYYLTEEESDGRNSRLWWQHETKKVRIAECWYKKMTRKKTVVLKSGETVEEVTPEMVALKMIGTVQEYLDTEVRLMTFFDNVILEDMESPYKHGEFPFVPFPVYYEGDDYIPAGIVRSLKDPQREINKRRSQELHILNTNANGGWMIEDGAMSKEQESAFKEKSTTPGAVIKVAPGAISGQRIVPLSSLGVNQSIVNATMEAEAEMVSVSGINESLMGTDIEKGASGRAIELKQKQAITHIALLFDNLRFAKERIAKLLWGRPGKPGIIPQFYTEEKTFRIVGENGKPEYVTVNQQVEGQNALGETITTTLNDLSIGEYDIIIADTPSTATQRTAQFWSLVDACGALGIQGNMVLDILLDLSDIAQKDEIKNRLRQQEEQQAQAQQQAMQMEQAKFQAQMELEREKKLSKSIAYKDLQLPMQLELAAAAGIFPKQYADAFMEWSVQQYAAQMGIPAQAPMQQPQIAQQQPQMPMGMEGIPPNIPMQQQAPTQARPLTEAARQGLAESSRPVL